jgi:hypothetical protein
MIGESTGRGKRSWWFWIDYFHMTDVRLTQFSGAGFTFSRFRLWLVLVVRPLIFFGMDLRSSRMCFHLCAFYPVLLDRRATIALIDRSSREIASVISLHDPFQEYCHYMGTPFSRLYRSEVINDHRIRIEPVPFLSGVFARVFSFMIITGIELAPID